MPGPDAPRRFHLETDASLNPGQRKIADGVLLKRAGGGIVIRSSNMLPVGIYYVSLGFLASNSIAEARVLLRGMRVARERHGASILSARTDAAEVVEIVNGRGKPHGQALRAVFGQIGAERSLFEEFELKWSRSSHAPEREPGVPTADSLARRAAGLSSR